MFRSVQVSIIKGAPIYSIPISLLGKNVLICKMTVGVERFGFGKRTFLAILNLTVGIHWLRLGRFGLSTNYGSGTTPACRLLGESAVQTSASTFLNWSPQKPASTNFTVTSEDYTQDKRQSPCVICWPSIGSIQLINFFFAFFQSNFF